MISCLLTCFVRLLCGYVPEILLLLLQTSSEQVFLFPVPRLIISSSSFTIPLQPQSSLQDNQLLRSQFPRPILLTAISTPLSALQPRSIRSHFPLNFITQLWKTRPSALLSPVRFLSNISKSPQPLSLPGVIHIYTYSSPYQFLYTELTSPLHPPSPVHSCSRLIHILIYIQQPS